MSSVRATVVFSHREDFVTFFANDKEFKIFAASAFSDGLIIPRENGVLYIGPAAILEIRTGEDEEGDFTEIDDDDDDEDGGSGAVLAHELSELSEMAVVGHA